MSNIAIPLKRLLERSYRDEGDIYCMKLLPRLLDTGEWPLRLSDLSEAKKDGLIAELSISEDCIAFWVLTPKGLQLEKIIREYPAWDLPLIPDQQLVLICLADTIDDNSLNLSKQSNLFFGRLLKSVIINQKLLKEHH